jgi:hypothetical protein
MGLFDSGSENNPAIEVEKINLGTTYNLMRIIDWELEVVLYTDTTREGYTSVSFEEANISQEDAPDKIRMYLEEDT